jgi:hypothetical protein
MPPELYAEEFETGLGLAVESAFGELTTPAHWVPGKCDLEYMVGYREVDLPINEAEETHVSIGRKTCDGKITFQVCPGQEGYFFNASTGILALRDRRRPMSFSAVKVMGEDEAAYYRGVCVNEFTLKLAKGEDMSLDCDCKGIDEAIGGPWVPNYTGLKSPFILEEMALYVAGMPRVNFDSVEIAEARDLRDDIYGNSLLRQDMTFKSIKRTIKLDGFRQKDLHILRDAHLSGAEVAFSLTVARGANSLTGSALQCMVWKCNPDNVSEPVELKVLKEVGTSVAGLVWS